MSATEEASLSSMRLNASRITSAISKTSSVAIRDLLDLDRSSLDCIYIDEMVKILLDVGDDYKYNAPILILESYSKRLISANLGTNPFDHKYPPNSQTLMPQKPKAKPVKVLPIIKFYLIAYNFLSCYGWLAVLYQTVDHLILTGGEYKSIYKLVAQLLQVVQTAAFFEIIHSLIGIVKAAPFPTMMQVASRLYIVWLILYAYPFPEVYTSYFFTSMVIAWCITEVVRYSFYGLNLLFGTAPYISVWMRYSFFFILYPIGAGSEFMLVQLAKNFEKRPSAYWGMIAVSAIYGPGFYYMYTHMIKQRRKYLFESEKKK